MKTLLLINAIVLLLALSACAHPRQLKTTVDSNCTNEEIHEFLFIQNYFKKHRFIPDAIMERAQKAKDCELILGEFKYE